MALLSSLYFAQGLPFGFFQQALPVLMRRRGMSLEHIGLGYLLALPWALKFLWAPLLDQLGRSGDRGRRRAAILPLQLATVALMVAVGLLAQRLGLKALLAGVFLANLLAATQDIATDGLAVDLLSERERGLGNGVQVAGYRVGMITGGGLLLIYLERLDRLLPGSAFLLMAALLLLATLPVALFREPPPRGEPPPRFGALLTDFWRRPGAAAWTALLLIYKFGEALANGMVRPFLVDRGLVEADIGRMLGVWGFSAGLCGSLLGGALVNRLGRRPALLLFAVVQALSVGGYLLLALQRPGDPRLLTALCAFEYLGSGLATAALFTAMMDVCRSASGASDYTAQASVVVIATLGGAALSGFVAQAGGFPAVFGAGVALCALAAAAVPLLGGAYTQLLRSANPP